MSKRLPIWQFFTVREDTRFAKCNICKEDISRGGKTTKTFNMTNLTYHCDVYDEKRNRLAPEKAEMLLFIKSNFKFCDIYYIHIADN